MLCSECNKNPTMEYSLLCCTCRFSIGNVLVPFTKCKCGNMILDAGIQCHVCIDTCSCGNVMLDGAIECRACLESQFVGIDCL